MLIKLFCRSAWSDWSSIKVDCLSVTLRLDEERSAIWNFIESSTVNFKMQIETSNVEFSVESVALSVED